MNAADHAKHQRGAAILATMQARRAYRDATPRADRSKFDEAHAVIERLEGEGYLVFAHADQRAAAMKRHPAGKALSDTTGKMAA